MESQKRVVVGKIPEEYAEYPLKKNEVLIATKNAEILFFTDNFTETGCKNPRAANYALRRKLGIVLLKKIEAFLKTLGYVVLGHIGFSRDMKGNNVVAGAENSFPFRLQKGFAFS